MKFIIIIILIPFLASPQVKHLFYAVDSLTKYMAVKQYNEINDLYAVDSLYLHAKAQLKGDLSEAFLSLTFAAIPYNNVPIKLPLLHVILNFPLMCSADSIYKIKNHNLPARLFFDTPADTFGDRDKNAHFFGSAFISYSSKVFDLGDLIGYFVEVFEESFEVQNQIDPRDIQANQLGNLFGKIIKKHPNVMPSQVLILKTLYQIRMNL
ncbi:MAG: hypothetical protein P4L35_12085 [Ignavibacteriaceae bacterium]|nr:hypothetical protein [Ignavibacteriaceae bacterium]